MHGFWHPERFCDVGGLVSSYTPTAIPLAVVAGNAQVTPLGYQLRSSFL